MFIPATGDNSDVANSYVDVAYADAYHDLRGNALWAGSDAVKQAALVRATDYLEQGYVGRFIGIQLTVPGLSWPRYVMPHNIDGIPENLKKATCELALEAFSKPLNPVTGGDRAVIREKVDVVEVEYSDKGIERTSRPAVVGYLSALISGSALNRPVVRV